jgi:hypothetical protein
MHLNHVHIASAALNPRLWRPASDLSKVPRMIRVVVSAAGIGWD